MLTPMNVAPNSTAETGAAATPSTRAGRAIPTAWTSSAASRSPGRDQRCPSLAHSAADGTAARPTSTQAPSPTRPGELCSIAATRKVPATMYPMPSRVYEAKSAVKQRWGRGIVRPAVVRPALVHFPSARFSSLRPTPTPPDAARPVGGASGRRFHEAAVSSAARAAEAHQAARQSATDRRPRTSRPDSAMPAPTPPNAQPDRWAGCSRRWRWREPTALTKTRALASPASSRSAIHTVVLCVAGMPARVPVSRTRPARGSAGQRTSAGARMPASAPRRHPA